MVSGVYLHIPFCKSRCSYCDFATDVYRDSKAVDRYVASLCLEIDAFGDKGGNTTGGECAAERTRTLATPRVSVLANAQRPAVDTIYFGGGTPSLLTPEQVERILRVVNDEFPLETRAEITMEMNPATVTADSLKGFRSLGVSRASFGVQTFDDRALKLLARGHDANDARQTFAMLRDAGFENISFDLIAGLPGQTIEAWERNLDEAIRMSPEHLSLYLLEVHEGTPLAEQIRTGRQPLPDEGLAARMYEMMCEKLARAGYEQYEISNFSRPGYESRHNSKYWRMDPVYGFGVSAHSFDGKQRYANERDTALYVEKIEREGCAEVTRETIDRASEYVFLGLRMNDGIDLEDFRGQFGRDLIQEYRREISELSSLELVKLSDRRLRLSPRGMLFSNEVFARFV